jgi:hypothetical protein
MDSNDTPPSYLSLSLRSQNKSYIDQQQQRSRLERENFPGCSGKSHKT